MRLTFLSIAFATLSANAFADDCQSLANTTMCIEADNNYGGHWFAKATFGAIDPLFKSGPMTLAGGSGTYECTGNNFATITYVSSMGDRGTWIAVAAKGGKYLSGTAFEEPGTANMYYRGRRIKPNGTCNPDTGPD